MEQDATASQLNEVNYQWGLKKSLKRKMSPTCKTSREAQDRLPLALPFISKPLLYARPMFGAFQKGILALLRGGKARIVRRDGSYRSAGYESPNHDIGQDQEYHWVIESI